MHSVLKIFFTTRSISAVKSSLTILAVYYYISVVPLWGSIYNQKCLANQEIIGVIPRGKFTENPKQYLLFCNKVKYDYIIDRGLILFINRRTSTGESKAILIMKKYVDIWMLIILFIKLNTISSMFMHKIKTVILNSSPLFF